MKHAFLLSLTLLSLVACSQTKLSTSKIEKVTLKAPIERVGPSSNQQSLIQQNSCFHTNCSPSQFNKSMNELGLIRVYVPNLNDIINALRDQESVIFHNGAEFFVIYAAELQNELLHIINRSRKTIRMSFASFMLEWEQGDYWANSFIKPRELASSSIPKDIGAQLYLMEKQNKKAAIATYKRLIELEVYPGLSYQRLFKIDKKTSFASLLNLFKNGINTYPNEKEIWNGYVGLLIKAGEKEKALKVREKVSKMFEIENPLL